MDLSLRQFWLLFTTYKDPKKTKNKPNQALYRDTCTSNNLHCVPTAPGSLAVLLKSQNTSHCFICIFILYSFVTKYIFCIHCFCEGFIRLCIFKMQVQNRYPICPCHSCENGNSPMYWHKTLCIHKFCFIVNIYIQNLLFIFFFKCDTSNFLVVERGGGVK